MSMDQMTLPVNERPDVLVRATKRSEEIQALALELRILQRKIQNVTNACCEANHQRTDRLYIISDPLQDAADKCDVAVKALYEAADNAKVRIGF